MVFFSLESENPNISIKLKKYSFIINQDFKFIVIIITFNNLYILSSSVKKPYKFLLKIIIISIKLKYKLFIIINSQYLLM